MEYKTGDPPEVYRCHVCGRDHDLSKPCPPPDWHIDGRDIFIQEWHTLKELTVEEAESILNKFAALEALNAELLDVLTRAENWADAMFGETWGPTWAGEAKVVIAKAEEALRI